MKLKVDSIRLDVGGEPAAVPPMTVEVSDEMSLGDVRIYVQTVINNTHGYPVLSFRLLVGVSEEQFDELPLKLLADARNALTAPYAFVQAPEEDDDFRRQSADEFDRAMRHLNHLRDVLEGRT